MTDANPSAPQIQVDPNAVIEVLCSTELGRALWERAQWQVAATALQQRVTQLQGQHASTPPAQDAEASIEA